MTTRMQPALPPGLQGNAIQVVAMLGERGVGLRTLGDGIDTTSSAGSLIFHLFAALAEFEAAPVRERTQARLVAARRRGKRLGRPKAMTADQFDVARTLMANSKLLARRVATQLGVHRATLYRSLAASPTGPRACRARRPLLRPFDSD